MTPITSRQDLQDIRERAIKRLIPHKGRIAVGMAHAELETAPIRCMRRLQTNYAVANQP